MTQTPRPTPPAEGPDGEDIAKAHATLADAAEALRVAVQRMHDSEDVAWRRYAEDTDEAMHRMQADLAVSAAELQADRASDKAGLEDALRQAAEALRSRVDEARVRVHLGELDARDAAERAWVEVERAGHTVTATLTEVRDEATHFTAPLRDRASGAISGLRRALLRSTPFGAAGDAGDAGGAGDALDDIES